MFFLVFILLSKPSGGVYDLKRDTKDLLSNPSGGVYDLTRDTVIIGIVSN